MKSVDTYQNIYGGISEWWGRYDDASTREGHKFFHSTNGPALKIYDDKNELVTDYYYENNMIHNINGPAIIRYKFCKFEFTNYETYPHGTYYILGKIVSKMDFDKPGFIDAFILEHS